MATSPKQRAFLFANKKNSLPKPAVPQIKEALPLGTPATPVKIPNVAGEWNGGSSLAPRLQVSAPNASSSMPKFKKLKGFIGSR